MFYVCEFPSGGLAVLPRTWIFKDNDKIKCRYTTSLEKTKNASLPNPNWRIFEISKIVGKKGKVTIFLK